MVWDERKVPLQRQQLLDEDIAQQRVLHKLSRRKADDPLEYAKREKRWIRFTHFGEAGLYERGPQEFD